MNDQSPGDEPLPAGISRRGSTLFARVKINNVETSRGGFATVADAMTWRAAEIRRRDGTRDVVPPLRGVASEVLARMERGAIRNRFGDAYDPSTVKRARMTLERHWLPLLGAHAVDKIRRADIQRILDELSATGAAGSTVRDALKPMQIIYRQLEREEIVARNPTSRLSLPRKASRKQRIDDPTDPMVVVGLKEAKQRIALLAPRERAVWALAFFAGLRMGEIRGLRWDDIDEQRMQIHVRRQIVTNGHEAKMPKGGKVRSVPISVDLRGELTLWALEQARDREGLVTGETRENPWTYGVITKRTRAAWDAAEVRWITPHEARHTFVSWLAASGVAADDARAWSGHTSDNVRELYTHVMPEAYTDAIRKMERYARRHA